MEFFLNIYFYGLLKEVHSWWKSTFMDYHRKLSLFWWEGNWTVSSSPLITQSSFNLTEPLWIPQTRKLTAQGTLQSLHL